MGLSPQLTLEAAILREGGFEGIAAGASVSELLYVRLSGNNPPGKSILLELKINKSDPPQFPGRRRRRGAPQARNADPRLRERGAGLHLAQSVDVDQPLRQLRRSGADQGMVGGRSRRGHRMSAPRANIPDAVRATQARASDPAVVGVRVRQCRLRQDPCAGAARDPAAARRRAAGENPLHHLHQGGGGQHGGAGFHHARPLGHARR